MKKSWVNALEKIWVAEIHDRLPLQSKAKVFKELEEAGMVQPYERDFGHDRLGSLRVTGWALTHVGRYLYCSECYDPSDAAP